MASGCGKPYQLQDCRRNGWQSKAVWPGAMRVYRELRKPREKWCAGYVHHPLPDRVTCRRCHDQLSG